MWRVAWLVSVWAQEDFRWRDQSQNHHPHRNRNEGKAATHRTMVNIDFVENIYILMIIIYLFVIR